MKLCQSAKHLQTKKSDSWVLFEAKVEDLSISTDDGSVTIQINDFCPRGGSGEYVAVLELSVSELIELLSRVSKARTQEIRSLRTKLEK